MTWESALALALVCFVPMITPGPGVLALIGHALTNGFRRSLGFIAGMVAGDLIFLSFAILGMAVIARSYEGLFMAIRLCAAAYLVYLGIKAWRAPPVVFNGSPGDEDRSARNHHARGFLSGLLTTLSNPKVIMFYIGVLPGFVDLAALSPSGVVTLAGIVIGVLSVLMLGYALAAGRARALLKSERSVRHINRGSGTVLVGVGLYIAVRT